MIMKNWSCFGCDSNAMVLLIKRVYLLETHIEIFTDKMIQCLDLLRNNPGVGGSSAGEWVRALM